MSKNSITWQFCTLNKTVQDIAGKSTHMSQCPTLIHFKFNIMKNRGWHPFHLLQLVHTEGTKKDTNFQSTTSPPARLTLPDTGETYEIDKFSKVCKYIRKKTEGRNGTERTSKDVEESWGVQKSFSAIPSLSSVHHSVCQFVWL